MKIVSIWFPDDTDISSLEPLAEVQVGTVPGGIVALVGQFPDPPPAASLTHTHEVAGGTGPPSG